MVFLALCGSLPAELVIPRELNAGLRFTEAAACETGFILRGGVRPGVTQRDSPGRAAGIPLRRASGELAGNGRRSGSVDF
jgi:hypothetical protein